MKREEVLKQAEICVCGKRQQDYGNPEDNFGLIADLWSAYSGQKYTAVDVAMMMALLKMARIKSGTGTDDSFVDLAGYAACAGEIAGNNREDKQEKVKPGIYVRMVNLDGTPVEENKEPEISAETTEVQKLLDDAKNVHGPVAEPTIDDLEVEIPLEPEKEDPEPPKEEEDKPEKKPKESKKEPTKKRIDDGKIMALRRAGWSQAKIADEMGISVATVNKHIKAIEAEGIFGF